MMSLNGVEAEVQEKEKNGKVQIADFVGQRRYEVGILTKVLITASEPVRHQDLIQQVKERVADDKADGLVPPYRVTTTLVRATLGIMVNLGAVERKKNEWSFTPRGREVMAILEEHKVSIGKRYT